MLAAVRCLYAAGFEVTAVGTARSAPGLWSVAAAERRIAPDPRRDVERFIERLQAIACERRYDVLLPGTDISLIVLSRHRDRLSSHVRLGLPAHEVVVRSLDKAFLASAAADVGLSPPEARTCTDSAQAVRAAESFGYPVVVKPVHTAVEVGGVASRWATLLAYDEAAVEAAAGPLTSCIVQRQVRGDVISFAGVAAGGGLLGFVVSRYLRTWPPHAGNVCFSQTIAPPPGLAERVEALVARIGWEGMFELELIEREGGRLAAIDFNPRAYGSLSLAVAAGVPLPALWCQWLLGDCPTPAAARVGVRYRWEDADFRHLVWQLRDGATTRALAVARPRRDVTHAYFRMFDPAPVLARAAQLLRRAPVRIKHPADARRPAVLPVDGLQHARESWNPLAERTANIFSTWEWAEVWWRHFGAGRTLMLGALRSRGRQAILPLYGERRAGIRVWRFLGHGVADQLGPVADPADMATAMSGLAATLSERGVLLAERMPAERDWTHELGGHVIHQETCGYIDLADEGSWEDYLRARSSNFRQQVRRRAKRLQRGLGLSFRLCDDADRLQADFDALISLHHARWGTASRAFDGPREAFHREFARRALERGWLRLWVAEAEGTPVAVWYGFRFAGIESYYQSGRDPGWDRYSIGAGLLEHSIRDAFADGMREYRMLRGDESYKGRYAGRSAPLSTIAVSRGSAGGAVVSAVRLASGSRSVRRMLVRFRD